MRARISYRKTSGLMKVSDFQLSDNSITVLDEKNMLYCDYLGESNVVFLKEDAEIKDLVGSDIYSCYLTDDGKMVTSYSGNVLYRGISEASSMGGEASLSFFSGNHSLSGVFRGGEEGFRSDFTHFEVSGSQKNTLVSPDLWGNLGVLLIDRRKTESLVVCKVPLDETILSAAIIRNVIVASTLSGKVLEIVLETKRKGPNVLPASVREIEGVEGGKILEIKSSANKFFLISENNVVQLRTFEGKISDGKRRALKFEEGVKKFRTARSSHCVLDNSGELYGWGANLGGFPGYGYGFVLKKPTLFKFNKIEPA